MNRDSEPAIRFDHVSKSFTGQIVLDDLSLDVAAGTAFCLLGRSGTGNSVTSKHIIGLIRPDRGRVFVQGQDVAALPPRELGEVRQRMGFLFQNAALFDSTSVGENVVTFPKYLPANPLVVEGHATQGTAGERYRGSRQRAALVREYLLGRYGLMPSTPASSRLAPTRWTARLATAGMASR